MEERAPDLGEATRLLPTQRIAEIFQRLAGSIRDLRSILKRSAEWSPHEK